MKLITKKILRLEDKLREVNQSRERTLREGWPETSSAYAEHAAECDAALQAAMDASPEAIERDTMPSEVATELLCEPKAHLTARVRKNCCSARETHYVSVRERKPGATKLATRLSAAKLTQLGKWLRRSIHRRAGTQRQFDRLKDVNTPQAEGLKQLLMVRGINLDIARAQIEAELTKRQVPFTVTEPTVTPRPVVATARPSLFARIGKVLGLRK